MNITLHHAHDSRSFRVLWLLNELGVDFDLVVHDFFDKSLRSPEYAKLSLAGRVPMLVIDGTVMAESGAMVEYLCEMFPDAGFGRAMGEAGRLEWLDWVHYAETIGQHCANLTQSHIMLREDWMKSKTLQRLEAKRLERVLTRVEQQLSDGRDYLLGDFSGADCGVGYGVKVAARFVRFDHLPNVAAYFERIAARAAYQASLPPKGAQLIYRQEFYEMPDAQNG